MARSRRLRRMRSWMGNMYRRMRSTRLPRRLRRIRFRRPRSIGNKKILGLKPLYWLFLGVLSYLFVAPFKNFVNGLFTKKP